MASIVLSIPDSLMAFVESQVSRGHHGDVSHYIGMLLAEARAKAQEAHFVALLLDGLACTGEHPGRQCVAGDIARHAERYEAQGLPPIARRFQAAVSAALESLAAAPEAGEARPVDDPRLATLRTWPVKGFAGFLAYYLAQPDGVTVLRVLHHGRDVETLPAQ